MSAILMNEVRQSWKRNSILLFLIARDRKELQNFFKPSSHIIVQTQGAQGVAEKILTNFHMIARSRKNWPFFCDSLQILAIIWKPGSFPKYYLYQWMNFLDKSQCRFPMTQPSQMAFLSFEYILSIPTTILWSDNSTRLSTPRWPYLQY